MKTSIEVKMTDYKEDAHVYISVTVDKSKHINLIEEAVGNAMFSVLAKISAIRELHNLEEKDDSILS